MLEEFQASSDLGTEDRKTLSSTQEKSSHFEDSAFGKVTTLRCWSTTDIVRGSYKCRNWYRMFNNNVFKCLEHIEIFCWDWGFSWFIWKLNIVKYFSADENSSVQAYQWHVNKPVRPILDISPAQPKNIINVRWRYYTAWRPALLSHRFVSFQKISFPLLWSMITTY